VRPTVNAPPIAWQDQALVFCNYCQKKLFESDNPGLEHLHGRGLDDSTIGAWGLGWHDRDRWRDPGKWALGEGKRIYLPRGVVIPWAVDRAIWHVKFRRFAADPKYIRIRGGTPTLYGLEHLAGKAAVVICEGELDAVLLHQEAGDLVDVVAVGTKAAKAEPKGLAHLLEASRWLLALDRDAEAEAETWAEYSGRVRRIRPLEGNDLTDFHNAGGDLRAWIEYHLGTDGRLDALEAALTETETRLDMVTDALEDQEAEILAEAEALLAGGLEDPRDRRRYRELMQVMGWWWHGEGWELETIGDLRGRS
jgi:hypothetical protein